MWQVLRYLDLALRYLELARHAVQRSSSFQSEICGGVQSLPLRDSRGF
jgi:hypothetical protein